MVLDGRKIVHTDVDVTQDPENKDKMRRIACNDAALPPQICNGDQYCGVSPSNHDHPSVS